MPRPAPLLDRLRALPLDRAPLRRAGVLAALLVVLLAAGQWFGASSSGPSVAEARRQGVRAAEEVSAPPPAPSWTAGRFVALVLLVAAGGAAAVLHRRRSGGAAASSSALEVLETHALSGGHSLRLVACGGEVLLLGVGAEGARVLRAWPRAAFDEQDGPSFADALADAEDHATAPPRPTAPAAPPTNEGTNALSVTDPCLARSTPPSPSCPGGELPVRGGAVGSRTPDARPVRPLPGGSEVQGERDAEDTPPAPTLPPAGGAALPQFLPVHV